MKKSAYMRWIAAFDMEPFISSILTWGILLSMALILTAIGLEKIFHPAEGFGPNLFARSIPVLLAQDLKNMNFPENLPRFVLHFGICVLLLTPYARLVMSFLYFLFIERDWMHSIFTGIVVVILTIGLLTQLV